MANTKISALTELDAKPATDDVLVIVDATGADTTKKITVANLFKSDLTGDVTGDITGAANLTSLVVATSTPASASATGTAGTITWDSSYIYICTATDTWERVAIASW